MNKIRKKYFFAKNISSATFAKKYKSSNICEKMYKIALLIVVLIILTYMFYVRNKNIAKIVGAISLIIIGIIAFTPMYNIIVVEPCAANQESVPPPQYSE
jgi:hypothetical protein